MRTFVLVLAILAATPATWATDGSRTVVEQYVAGTGDVACAVSGLGCVRLFGEGVESSVALRVDDTTGLPIAFDVCSPDCDGIGASFCGSGTIAGITPGTLIVVFLREATGVSTCGLFRIGVPTTGTLTATFT